MEKCTICGTESKENICPVCGNERTADAVRYGTFAPLPKAAADIRNGCIAKYKARLGVETKAQPEQRASNENSNKGESQSQIPEHKPTGFAEAAEFRADSHRKSVQDAKKQQQEEAEERAKRAEALRKENEKLKRQLEETAQANKQQEEAAKLKHFDEVIKQEPSQEAPPKQKAKMSRLLTMLKLAIMILGAPSFVVIFISYFVPLPFTVEMIALVFGIASLVIFIKENK